MDVRVTGHQVDIGETLRDHAASRMEAIAQKYFSRAVAAKVTLGKGPHNDFTCDIVAPVTQGVVLKASNRGQEARLAFEGAADKIEKQLRRYANRLRDRKSEGPPEIIENAPYRVFETPSDSAEPASNPAIVAETRVDIPDTSVSDAVMLMDLRNTNALMFRNSVSGELNMIYRREDGTIGWVEPSAG